MVQCEVRGAVCSNCVVQCELRGQCSVVQCEGGGGGQCEVGVVV